MWKNCKIFESNGFTEEIVKELIWRNLSLVRRALSRVNSSFSHTHCAAFDRTNYTSVEKWKIYSHRKKISSNQLFSNFFSTTKNRCFHEIEIFVKKV